MKIYSLKEINKYIFGYLRYKNKTKFIGHHTRVGKKCKFVNSKKYLTLKNNVQICDNVSFYLISEYYEQKLFPNCVLEEFVSIGRRCEINVTCNLSIGKRTILGPDVYITTCNHNIDPSKFWNGYTKLVEKDVIIEDEVWIGTKAIILPGVTIGHNSVVGAGAVVTKSFPPYSLIGGVPAKLIRKLK